MPTSLYIPKKINQITTQYVVFRFKCYNLPFFGCWDGNVDNTHCFDFFSCNQIYISSICARLQTSSASPSILINLFKVAILIYQKKPKNYRPTHEQTNILLDQLQKHFFIHITCTGGGGCTIIEIICLI